jgi:hypothetical protein
MQLMVILLLIIIIIICLYNRYQIALQRITTINNNWLIKRMCLIIMVLMYKSNNKREINKCRIKVVIIRIIIIIKVKLTY